MKFMEFYQEEPGGSFTHNGIEYLLNPLLKFTDKLPIEEVDVDQLSWIITDPNEESEYADISAPILVTPWNDKLVVIDGYHRLLKSVKLGKKTIPAKMVDDRLLSYFEKR